MIILGSAGQGNDDAAQGFNILMGIVVMALPLWLTPLLIRFSTGIMGQVAGIVNNKSKGLIDRSRNVRNRKAGLAMHETLGSKQTSRNPFSRVYRRMQNSSQADARRQDIINSRNQTAFTQSERGENLDLSKKAASETLAAANESTNALYEELKSGQVVVPLNRKATSFEAQNAAQELHIQRDRLRSAQGVEQQEYAKALAGSPTLAKRAGGIDPRGESRVVAAANSAIAKAQDDAIAAEKTTMTQLDSSQLSAIMQDTSASIERRAAAAGQLVRTGADTDIYNALDYVGGLAKGESTTTLQQQIAADVGARKPYSIGAADFTKLGQGAYSGQFSAKVVGRIQGGKLSPDTVLFGGADELQQIINVADSGGISRSDPNYTQLKSQVATYLANPNNKQPPKEILDLVTKL